MAAHEPEAHGGPVPKPKKFSVPRRKQDEERLGRAKKPFQVAAGAFMVVCLAIAGLLIWAAASVPMIHSARHKIELKQMSDINYAFREACKDSVHQRRLRELENTRGQELYASGLKQRVFDPALVSKLVSLNSTTDTKADKAWISEPDGQMPDDGCSYTAPRAGDLPELLERKGEDRVVLVTFNARNWNNYPEHGVIVLWSDADAGEFLTFKEARKEWGITEEEWADPAGKLLGKKAPFQFTYE